MKLIFNNSPSFVSLHVVVPLKNNGVTTKEITHVANHGWPKTEMKRSVDLRVVVYYAMTLGCDTEFSECEIMFVPSTG